MIGVIVIKPTKNSTIKSKFITKRTDIFFLFLLFRKMAKKNVKTEINPRGDAANAKSTISIKNNVILF